MQHELEYYKTELAKHISASHNDADNNLKTKLADSLKTATDPAAVHLILDQIWFQSLSFNTHMETELTSLLSQFAQKILPPVHKNFIFSAETNSINFPEQYTLENTSEGTKIAIRRKDPTFSSPFHAMLPPSTNEELRLITSNLKGDISKMNEIKDEIVNQVKRLDYIVKTSFYDQLSAEEVLKLIEDEVQESARKEPVEPVTMPNKRPKIF